MTAYTAAMGDPALRLMGLSETFTTDKTLVAPEIRQTEGSAAHEEGDTPSGRSSATKRLSPRIRGGNRTGIREAVLGGNVVSERSVALTGAEFVCGVNGTRSSSHTEHLSVGTNRLRAAAAEENVVRFQNVLTDQKRKGHVVDDDERVAHLDAGDSERQVDVT